MSRYTTMEFYIDKNPYRYLYEESSNYNDINNCSKYGCKYYKENEDTDQAMSDLITNHCLNCPKLLEE